MKLTYLFLLTTLMSIVCLFTSENTGEILAWSAALCFSITSGMLSAKLGKELEKKDGDEGR